MAIGDAVVERPHFEDERDHAEVGGERDARAAAAVDGGGVGAVPRIGLVHLVALDPPVDQPRAQVVAVDAHLHRRRIDDAAAVHPHGEAQPLGVREHLELDTTVRARDAHRLHAHAAAATLARALPLLLGSLLRGVGPRRLAGRLRAPGTEAQQRRDERQQGCGSSSFRARS